MNPTPDNASAPRLLGFDVPDLQATVDQAEDEAIVAMLDVAPSARWLQVFHRRVDALKGELGLAACRWTTAPSASTGPWPTADAWPMRLPG